MLALIALAIGWDWILLPANATAQDLEAEGRQAGHGVWPGLVIPTPAAPVPESRQAPLESRALERSSRAAFARC